MLKNNIEIDVKTKCIEEGRTQAQVAEGIQASPSYVNKIVRNKEQIINKTFLAMMEDLGYDVRLTYERREPEMSQGITQEQETVKDAAEKQFDEAMIQLYKTAKQECGYNATYFLQMISEMGGLAAAKQLIHKDKETDGFIKLWMCGRLDLTVENHVIQPEFRILFTDEEREICKERLKAHGFDV